MEQRVKPQPKIKLPLLALRVARNTFVFRRLTKELSFKFFSSLSVDLVVPAETHNVLEKET